MLFEKVKEEHILQGIKDFEEKGLPNGFGTSSTYDLIFDNKSYPPKAVMAYANFYASGRKIERYFKGGLETDCFKAFERNGYKIEKKNNSMNENLYKLKQDFLNYWTLDRLQNMTLEEYTDTEREKSFCYWLEHLTRDLGSIVGGSSYKFGIYKRNSNSDIKEESNRTTDGEYAWFKKYGENTKEEAFTSVKNIIIRIATSAKNNNLTDIDDIDLGHSYKWKIAFLYSDFNCLNIFKKSWLVQIAYGLDVGKENLEVSELNNLILTKKPTNEDFFDFSNRIRETYGDKEEDINTILSNFEKWLKKVYRKKDGTPLGKGSIIGYLSGIKSIAKDLAQRGLLNDNQFFNIIDFEVLESLHKDYFKIEEVIIKNNTGNNRIINSFSRFIEFKKSKKIELIENKMIDPLEENIFELYKDYLYETRRNEIADTTIEGYVETASYRITERWEEEYNEDFANFKLNLNCLIKIKPLVEKGFSGYTSFRPFIYELIEEFTSNLTLLNQILYGPPGTGKTYKTKELAVNIILGKEERSRTEILNLYDELLSKEQISFTTFHQSMSYEDFVEGIKPKMEDDEETLKYKIEKGIFKRIADKAKGISGSKQKDNSIDFSKSNYFKMSIGGKHRIDVHNWCVANDLVALGWGDNEDYSEYNNINNWNEFRDKFKKEFPYLVESSKYNIQAMFIFQKMKIGDIVLVSLGNHILDAVGIIEGSYEYDSENEFGFHHYRKVKWLGTNMSASPEIFIDKGISQQSIYEFNKQDIKIESFKEYFSEAEEIKKNPNYVLIIDEINRGNISSIFGELITLLEEDKRSGQAEEIEVILPYSKEPFKVPSNLYIIGTMNTADRSVEALDTALRRRFSFTEVAPNSELLKDKNVEEIELKTLLQTINDRIELLIDKDHKIGHSYFLNIETLEDLKQTFKNKVIPLLEEYFFGDYGKIGLVLGDGFIKLKDDEDKISFAKNFTEKYEDAENLREKAVYTFTDEDSWDKNTFISIYEQ